MQKNPQVDSNWRPSRQVIRVKLLADEHLGISALDKRRAALQALDRDESLEFVEVDSDPDVVLIAGSAKWASVVVRHSRSKGDQVPIVVLNASAETGSIARILDDGADDCLPQAFDPSELRARITSVMRRVRPGLVHSCKVAADRANLRVRVGRVETQVTRKQFEVFVYLAERRERWVHTEEIIAAVSGTHHDPATSLVRVQVHALRKALGVARHCILCDGHKSYMLTLASDGAAGNTLSELDPAEGLTLK